MGNSDKQSAHTDLLSASDGVGDMETTGITQDYLSEIQA